MLHATLTFHRAQLLYDLRNLAYIESHLLPDELLQVKHMVADIAEPGNIDRISRILALRHSHVVEELLPYTARPVQTAHHEHPWTDPIVTPDTYTIHLHLPDTVSQTTINHLEHLIHEYLVTAAFADWLAITLPDKAATWQARADEALSRVTTTINHRPHRTHRPLHPF